MNILLISTNRNVHPMPVMPIGVCAVAESCERNGHAVKLVDLMFDRDAAASIGAAITAHRPDVVGLSVRNIDNNDMRDPVFFLNDLAQLVNAVRKTTGAPVVLGGAALGVMPEAIMRHAGVSCAVVADGEYVFPLLVDRIAAGGPFDDIPGVALLNQGVFSQTGAAPQGSLSGCIAPDYHRWVNVGAYRAHLAAAPLQTKLGCPFQCVYCTYRRIEGAGYRLCDPEAVAEAVTRLVVSGIRDIEFVDSVFNAPREHALAVCEALARRDHRARLQSLELNPAFIDDELLTAMEQAGFVGIGVTAESASEPVLRGLRKGFTRLQLVQAAEVVRRHRIPCAWIFLMGGPGESQETVRETLDFAAAVLRPQDVAFFNVGIRMYPGTELERIAREEGYFNLSPQDMLRPLFYVSPSLSAAWIMDEIKRSLAGNMSFLSSDSLNLSFLPSIHRIGYLFGLRPPLWKYTRRIRRTLRMFGMDV